MRVIPPPWTVKLAIAIWVALLLLAIGVPAAHADQAVAQADNAVVTIDTERCSDAKVLVHIKPEFHQVFYVGSVVYQGATHSVCWTLNRGIVVVFWQDGTRDELQAAMFEWKP